MEDNNTSLESIVVLSDSLVSEHQSHLSEQIRINCINENDTLYHSQMTLRNSPLNDTGSSSFLGTNAESECIKMEKEILALRSQLNAYKTENYELRKIIDKRKNSDSFIDIDAVCLVEKIEKNLLETNKIFSEESNLKDSMKYLVKSLWSSIAFEYADGRLVNISRLRDELLDKIDKSTHETNQQRLKILEDEVELFKNNNHKLKIKLEEQNKILNDLAQVYTKSKYETACNSKENKDQAPVPVNDFYYYNTNGYIAIDQDLSLNEDLQQSQNLTKPNHQVNNSNLLKCPKCLTTVDAKSISYDMYQSHVENCDGDANHVCMFCLCWFSKDQQQGYLNHIDIHLKQLGNELNNF
ncbi:unnamed protein product [Brachionus calyciflorus]|uniref:UBZ1-type domain-containing protein n=1 Tax=Brachionus calyciflorus TaxID=104777 RepID=A0A813VVV2_9BILA|nr:unnamed protein product [Brachionus calyciflorus]